MKRIKYSNLQKKEGIHYFKFTKKEGCGYVIYTSEMFLRSSMESSGTTDFRLFWLDGKKMRIMEKKKWDERCDIF